MSVDVEDWSQAHNLRSACPIFRWNEFEIRAHFGVDQLLEILDSAAVTASFFVVGYIAHRCPSIVCRITNAGHEIGIHGYYHEMVPNLTPQRFREDLHRCREEIEDFTGCAVTGYRAPTCSITDWALDILAEEGFKYDTSHNPSGLNHRFGKLEGCQTRWNTPWEARSGLRELPMAVLPIADQLIPWGGAGYFRLVPYRVFRRGVRSILGRYGYYNLFIHPWELDAEQPHVRNVSRLSRFRHYVNLGRTARRLEPLVADFDFVSAREAIRLVETGGWSETHE